ncbi:hypothetical protein P171DRAFT_170860 [Karstenula rhodostoma CBS 690.94]|uniref:Uncharacterized protein n=1 Tax=Karstenula rhodostoma CBS 690.94 TaxID=1392251 RepID=A0A9P4U602_9PLEO|nr:hypothetical protein P171DRAFT_170860 [Karstenula rhodostoma CBS 690.94]
MVTCPEPTPSITPPAESLDDLDHHHHVDMDCIGCHLFVSTPPDDTAFESPSDMLLATVRKRPGGEHHSMGKKAHAVRRRASRAVLGACVTNRDASPFRYKIVLKRISMFESIAARTRGATPLILQTLPKRVSFAIRPSVVRDLWPIGTILSTAGRSALARNR